MKISLTGTHGSGKTSLLNAIASNSLPIKLIQEVPRQVTEDLDDPTSLHRGTNTLLRQALIITRQISDECRLESRSSDPVLCDRSVIDHWAYNLLLFSDWATSKEGQSWEKVVRDWSLTYDLFMLLPVPSWAIRSDGVREDDLEFQIAINDQIIRLIEGWSLKSYLIDGNSVQDRAADALRKIQLPRD